MEAREMSQQQLAKEVGISPPHLCNILSGTREITLKHARSFARVFGVSPLLLVEL
jgi:antitoxin component HigA of HigAB toxin-antitoxin module